MSHADDARAKVRSPGSRHAAEPGARHAGIYAFRSNVTDRIGRAVGFPVAVLSAADDPVRHARRLTASWHAAWTAAPEGWFAPFDSWSPDLGDIAYTPIAFDGRWMGLHPMPPGVSLANGGLRVTIPPGTVTADLETVFGLAMSDEAFDAVARLPSEVRRRFGTGRRADVGPRYSRDPEGTMRDVILVRDLYRFRPKDLPRVASADALAADGLTVSCTLRAPGARAASRQAGR